MGTHNTFASSAAKQKSSALCPGNKQILADNKSFLSLFWSPSFLFKIVFSS